MTVYDARFRQHECEIEKRIDVQLLVKNMDYKVPNKIGGYKDKASLSDCIRDYLGEGDKQIRKELDKTLTNFD